MEKDKFDVFISYSRKDYVDENKNVIPGNFVSKIKETLANEGISYWFDEEGIYSGQNFVEKIVTNIEASKIFVYLSSANANSSQWTCKEIACADEFKKHIIPVRIDRTPYNKKVLFRIADLDYIEYYSNPEKGLKNLIDSVKAYLEQLEAEAKRQKAEEERKLEEERKRQESERKRKAEEDKKKAEEEQKTINAIKLSCTALNSEEAKIEVDRSNLLLKTEIISDKEKQDTLKKFIIESSPVRQKYRDEMVTKNQRLSEELSQANVALAKSRQECERLAQKSVEIQTLTEVLGDKETESNVKIHTIYVSLVIILLIAIGYLFFSSSNNSGNFIYPSYHGISMGFPYRVFYDSLTNQGFKVNPKDTTSNQICFIKEGCPNHVVILKLKDEFVDVIQENYNASSNDSTCLLWQHMCDSLEQTIGVKPNILANKENNKSAVFDNKGGCISVLLENTYTPSMSVVYEIEGQGNK